MTDESAFFRLLERLRAREVRFVLIGVAGANYWAVSGGHHFSTEDRDLLLPPEAENLLQAWQACEEAGLELSAGGEPLDFPRDLDLAQRVVERRALTSATDGDELFVDLTFLMAGFRFDEIWARRHHFKVAGMDLPVAQLIDIVRSKAAVRRKKDLMFLETYAQDLEDMLGGRSAGLNRPKGDPG